MDKRWVMLPMLFVPLAAYGQANTTIEQKMRDMIIPCVEFRGADPVDVLEFLIESCTASVPDTPSLGLLSTNPPAARVQYTYEVEDGSPLELFPLTLEYRRISMAEALDRITKALGLTCRLEHGAPIFFTRDGKRIIRNIRVEQGVPHGAKARRPPEPEQQVR